MIENGASGIGLIYWILIILVLAFVIWLFIKAAQSRGSSNFIKKEEDLEILKGRYESGEINEIEYKKKRDELVGRKGR